MTQQKIFSKIISGGQTGADQGALDAALELNHPCGGWCPKGRKSEAGAIPHRYPVHEHESENYKVRTEANIKDSDGTLVYMYGKATGGTALTIEFTEFYGKPLFIIDLEYDPLDLDSSMVWEWGHENEVFVLNVAGPRESEEPGTHTLVKSMMLEILDHARKFP